MDFNKKKKNFKYFIYLTVLLFVVCCSYQGKERVNDKKTLVDSMFTKLKTLNMDSLKKISVFYRGSRPLYVIKCFYGDSCKSIAMLLMRNEKNEIAIKLSNRLTAVDSLEYYYPLQENGFSKERIVYCFNVMEALSIEEISTSCDYKGLIIKKDSLKFYYLFDTILNKEYNIDKTLRKLDSNWWVEK